MRYLRLMMAAFFVPVIFAFMSCDDDKDKKIDEAEVLLQYLENQGGDYINTASCPSMITAADVLTTMGGSQYIIDIRSAADFSTLGHIDGAVNVPLTGVLDHVEAMDPAASTYSRIVIACYSGQSASYVTGLLRLAGYSNVYCLKWGMTSWHDVFAAGKWPANISNARATDFVTTSFPKAAAGDYPEINTGFENAEEILRARIQAVLADGFTPATVSNSTLYTDLDAYYIVNYWSMDHYNVGHIDGAIQYTPKTDLHSSTYLNTLPTDVPVVVYCYTGQTSAHIAGFLRVLGYDGKTLLWGANGMIYDVMTANSMTTFKDDYIMDYPYVTGN